MKTRSMMCVALLGLAAMAYGPVKAELPADWPGLQVTTYDPAAVGEGYIFIAVASITPGVGTYLMVVDNSGDPVWYEKLDTHEIYDFKVNPNGFTSCAPFIEEHSYTGGGDAYHQIRNENYEIVEEVHGKNGYVAESHDFQILPNGNLVQFGYYFTEVDMSGIINGGHPAALVAGGVIQELDAQRNVVWQWRSWDYHDFETYDSWGRRTSGQVLAPWHLNTINQDPDGNFIVGTPGEVWKLNRQTGERMWTLGPEFTLVGADADYSHFGGHATYRLENGNFLMYDNGGRGGGSSTIHEYTIDEVNMTATHVWSWDPTEHGLPEIPAWHRGNAQRLPNGNTVIGWGGASGQWIPVCTEVNPAGEVVFEMYFSPNSPQVESYRAFRFPYPPATQAVEFMEYELAEGNEYDFPGTGVSIKVDTLVGDGYNEMTVVREPYAPVHPAFASLKAPRLLPVRFNMTHYGIEGISARLSFDTSDLNIDDPGRLTIYRRAHVGQGIFMPLTDTNYNPVTHRLRGTMTGFGEFCFGYPDVADVPYEPILNRAENYRGEQHVMPIHPRKAEPVTTYMVNQELPILLSWSPRGFGRWYQFELAAGADFASPVVNMPYVTDEFYVFETAQPNTTYYWRVKTSNDGGESVWAIGSFRTILPTIEVIVPAADEVWKQGLEYFIQWTDNVAEDVILELYKNGAKVADIATAPSDRAWEWEVPLDAVSGCGYAIKITSSTDPGLSAMSAHFVIGSTLDGDLNCDNVVDIDDFGIMAGDWRKAEAGLAADLNEDGKVDLSDLAQLLENWPSPGDPDVITLP